MNLLSLGLSSIPWPEAKTSTISLDTLIRRLEAAYQSTSGVAVTPENCMESPTVHAIVSGISRRLATYPLHVQEVTESNGRTKKERLPNHPVQRLLDHPNDWQDTTEYWLDAASYLLRYGRFAAWKARGATGPIRRLLPFSPPSQVRFKQDSEWRVTVEITMPNGSIEEHSPSEIHYARGPARDGLNGNSPAMDCREAIGMEIASEKFAATFFGNGAMPGVVFELMDGFQGFKTETERETFLNSFNDKFSRSRPGGRMSAMFLPKGVKLGDKFIGFENDKAQLVESRKHQRNVIAGAFGVPPDLVGDLERQTYNNAEQQSRNLILNVMLPIARIFETAMERDLLTLEDRRAGIAIRFNLEGAQRADYKTQQDGLRIQREAGVITANEWREEIGKNPIGKEDGGDEYWRQGPSGQSAKPKQPVDPNADPPPEPRDKRQLPEPVYPGGNGRW